MDNHQLYEMSTKNIKTGEVKKIYGYTSINVIQQYIGAYADNLHEVIVKAVNAPQKDVCPKCLLSTHVYGCWPLDDD